MLTVHFTSAPQPPWDDKLDCAAGKPFHVIHYTYGMDYNLEGEFTPGKYGQWRFDKRACTGRPMPRHLLDPPVNMKNELVRTLMNAFEEATVAIPCWDAYQSTGKLPETCTEEANHFLALQKSTGGKP
ncbi:hypothetical protein FOA52_013381 [Chlamydomonas sp. UWO 241]|nr:hypothetical protein FOA52_013381 [Chlamydomonas sp. UWO 241]